ncbi:MAG: helix-turn-helix domain-containing protein [Elusimicrobiota bacterium]|nr:helix-turn-helix domain-containing protein [Elusimicrobiota bacterium]
MTATLRVFVSSVQKELEDERLIVQNLVSTDLFLSTHCVPVLYEFEPASADKALEGCLKSLDACHVYLLIVGVQYGTPVDKLSITHAEYRRAKKRKLPILAFIKGNRRVKREKGTVALLAELDADGPKYKRFDNVIELQKEVRAALLKLLRDRFIIAPTSDENEIAEQTIEATSTFESRPLDRVRWQDLDLDVARRLIAATEQREADGLSKEEMLAGAALRGLVWHKPGSGEHYGTGFGGGSGDGSGWHEPAPGEHYATAAGIVLLAKDPSAVFPQCRILADAYRATEPDGDPRDHEDIRGPMPLVIQRAIAFIDRNTRHPMRIVGLDRVRLDEYPVDSLREALVNAVAHRQYEDDGRKILLEVFADRVALSSPGLPPKPITLASLRKGKYRSCSRNPVLAQCLSYFHRIEERGSGFRRMRDQMLDHGLDQPILSADMGYFQITFPGPGNNVKRLRVPADGAGKIVPPSVEGKLNDRQKKILAHLLNEGFVTSGWCRKHLPVVYDTIRRDLLSLIGLGVIKPQGQGRSTRYVLKKNL